MDGTNTEKSFLVLGMSVIPGNDTPGICEDLSGIVKAKPMPLNIGLFFQGIPNEGPIPTAAAHWPIVSRIWFVYHIAVMGPT